MSDEPQWETYDPVAPERRDEPTAPARPRRGPGRLVATILTAVLVVGVGAGVAAVVSTAGDDPSATQPATDDDEPPPAADAPPAEPPAVLSVEGYADLVEAVREQTGSTDVFRAVLYPDYGSVSLPEDRRTLRARTLSWGDGAFDERGSTTGTSTMNRVDLGDIDAALLLRLLKRVRAVVDDPTSSYVVIEGGSAVGFDDGTRIRAYATNQYSETAYIATDTRGRVIRRVGF